MDANIATLMEMTSCSREAAVQYLEASQGDINLAVELALTEGSASPVRAPQAPAPFAQAPAARAPAAAPPAAATSAAAASKPAAASSGRRFGTMDDLKAKYGPMGGGGHHDDDEEEEEDEEQGREMYSGGTSSGLAVQAPGRKIEGGKGLMKQIRKASAMQPHGGEEEQESDSFGGAGYRLGESASAPIQKIGKSLSEVKPMKRIVVAVWANGLSIDDGVNVPDFRPADDPRNITMIRAIQMGVVPPELQSHGTDINLDVEDHHHENYTPPKRAPPSFSGAGFKMSAATAPVPAGAAAVATPKSLNVDESKPVTKIQFRLADGTRLVGNFNLHHTIGDIRGFIASAQPGSRAFMLMTTFPNKVLADDSETIEHAKLMNGSIVQKFV